MGRLIALIFMAPFWVHFLLAGGAGYLGWETQKRSELRYQELQRLSQIEAPSLVSITAFQTDAPPSLPQEVNLRAQIAIEHNVHLIKKRNGITTSDRSMYILVAPDAPEGTTEALGAVVVATSERDAFLAWFEEALARDGEVGALGPILSFNGLRDWPSDTTHIQKALKAQGFTSAANFVYLMPFMQGRAAGLIVSPADKATDLFFAYVIAGCFVLSGLVKWARRGKRLVAAPAPASAPTSSVVPADPAVVQQPLMPPLQANDFIGALARKNAQKAEAAPAAKRGFGARATAPAQPKEPKPARTKRGPGWLAKKGLAVAAAAVLYLGLMHFSGPLMPTNVSLTASPKKVQMFAPEPDAVIEPQDQAVIATAPEIAPTAAAEEPTTPAAADAMSAPPPRIEDMAGSALNAVATKFKAGMAAMRALFAAPPLWLVMVLLATVIAVPAIYLLKRLASPRKSAHIDPFERLMQRRLAEMERDQNAQLQRHGLQQA